MSGAHMSYTDALPRLNFDAAGNPGSDFVILFTHLTSCAHMSVPDALLRPWRFDRYALVAAA